jgi:hypothetical protein
VLEAEGLEERLFSFVGNRRTALSVVQERNFQRWPILGTYVWPNRVVTGSYRGEVLALDGWLFERYRWLDQQLSGN